MLVPCGVRIISRPSNNDVFLVLDYKNERQICLKWTPDIQSFRCVHSTHALTSSHDETLDVVQVDALYGALPLGEFHTALLYVVKATRVATLPEEHEVMGIDEMQVMLLPARPSLAGPTPPTPKLGPDAPRSSSPSSGSPLPMKAIHSYVSLLKQFAAAKDPNGGSRLYFSPTTRLNLPTINEVVQEALGCQKKDHSSSDTSGSTPSLNGFQSSPVSDALYLWNGQHWRSSFPSPMSFDGEEELFGFVPNIVRGYIGEATMRVSAQVCLHVLLVCRLAAQRAGTRYNRRGVDRATGVTANFAETSQLVFARTKKATEDSETSGAVCGPVTCYTLLRGSVPCYWDQHADLTLKPAIRLDHNDTASDLMTHVALLADLYRHQCSAIHCIDTLSRSRLEAPLSDAFAQAVRNFTARCATGEVGPRASSMQVVYQRFDVGRNLHVHRQYHDLQSTFLSLVRGAADRFGVNVWQRTDTPTGSEEEWASTSTQTGMFRVNCLDCLDRTNLTQSMVCLHMLSEQVDVALGRQTVSTSLLDDLDPHLRQLWAEHGRSLSQLYAGTQPHFLDILVDKRRSLWSARMEPTIALRRFVQQNFFDGDKQDAVSLVTGAHNTRPHRSGVIQNPFDRRVVVLNRFLMAGFVISACAFMANALMMLRYERYRGRFDFVAFQMLWGFLLGTVTYQIRKDPFGFTNYSVLH